MDPRRGACELVSEFMQLTHLLEQRLELHLVNRHDWTEDISLNEPVANAALVFEEQRCMELSGTGRRIVERPKYPLPVVDRPRHHQSSQFQRRSSRVAVGSSTRAASS